MSGKWWCVLEIDPEITRYYRWWIKRQYHVKGLYKPSWDAHVSIIRGEKPAPKHMKLWKKYHGQKVKIRYEHRPHVGTGSAKEDRKFWMVMVDAPELLAIRSEMEKPSDWRLHLTIGVDLYVD
jgi:hypothetical protein